MSGHGSIKERISEFQPSKTLWFWSCAGVCAATIAVGFTLGGWVTRGTAQEMADNAAQQARAQLVANVCVERFTESKQFASRLAELKNASSWDREDMLTKGNWIDLTGIKEPIDNAASLCASRLVEMKTPDTAPTPKDEPVAG